MNTLVKGDVVELFITCKLVKLGNIVLKPLISGCRYDLLLDNQNGTFSRIQCKHGRLKDGYITFNTCSLNKETHIRTNYIGQIEYFGVYCTGNNEGYLIPIDKIRAKSECRLRICNINRKPNILYAKDFEL